MKKKRSDKEVSNSGKRKPFLFPDHPLPLTRRQFLAAGLLESVVMIAAPTLGLFASKVADAATQPSFLVLNFDASGGDGGSTHGTFLALTSTGGLVNTGLYPSMGIYSNLSASGSYTTSYGAPMVVGTFTQTLESLTTGISLSSRLKIANMTANLRDDTVINSLTPDSHGPAKMVNAYLAQKYKTTLLIQGGVSVGGEAKKDSGQAQGSRSITSTSEGFIIVNSSTSISQALTSPFVIKKDSASASTTTMSDARGQGVVSALDKIAAGRASRVTEEEEKALQTSLSTGYGQLLNTLKSLQNVNTNPDDATYGLKQATRTIITNAVNAGTISSSEATLFKAGLYAAVTGLARNELNVVLSGGDYHDFTFTSTAAFVARKATYLAAAIVECNARAMPLVFTSITDGGMRIGAYGEGFGSDEGRWAMAQVGMFDPAATPSLKSTQVGANDYSTGFALTNNLIGGNPEMLGLALFTSVLGALKEQSIASMVRSVVGTSKLGTLTDSDITSLNVFNYGG